MQASTMQTTEGITHTNSAEKRHLPETLQFLEQVSQNFWWSWTAEGANIFRDLDSTLWETAEQNPRRVLREISDLHLWQRANDPQFVQRVKHFAENFDHYLAQPCKTFSGAKRKITPENPVAYFCAEYGVHNSLPLYSGGLGILAGDHLKSASDLQVPLVAVGLFYRFGYFRQNLSAEGLQIEQYMESAPSNLAVSPVFDETGERLKVRILMRGNYVHAQAWKAQIGRVPLYLLDTNVAENSETDRLISGHLYGGDKETRVVQEMLLGIGGVRLLRKLNIEPAVYHLNEGHSAFLTLELTRELTDSDQKMSFPDAFATVREQCVFTTHTPIAAGNDEFPPSLIEKCFGDGWLGALGLTKDEFFGLGRTNPENNDELFGMTPLSLKMCRSSNGVSEKHGEVSRALWLKMFPAAENADEVPITFVTNGVHAPTWIAPGLKALYEKYCGAKWADLLENETVWTEAVAQIPDEEIWQVHNSLKNQLIALIRHKTFVARAKVHEPSAYIEEARNLFEPNVLTIGFARRVAGYKRWNLLLSQPERLLNLIDNAAHPVQFVFAGKAHPQDRGAKTTLQQLIDARQNSAFARRAIFIQDYDQEIARYLVQGVDVWMNVPRRPLEASGTSGEKVAMNGGLNFSILDGWWIEGYNGINGFAINDLGENDANLSEAEIDLQDANALYETLEKEIIPGFYERGADNLPRQWIARMRNSLQTLTPQFSSDRMLRDYIKQIYC